MSNINTEKLIEDLIKTKKRNNIELAKRISKRHYSNTFSPKRDVPKMIKTDKLAKNVLCSLLDEESLKTLVVYDTLIESIIQKITSKTGWDYYQYQESFILYDNFKNMDDHEFRSFDKYRVHRTNKGFTHSTTDPYNGYLKHIQEMEKDFVRENRKDLFELNHLLILREELLNGNFKVKDEQKKDLAMELIYFLNLVKEAQEEKVSTK